MGDNLPMLTRQVAKLDTQKGTIVEAIDQINTRIRFAQDDLNYAKLCLAGRVQRHAKLNEERKACTFEQPIKASELDHEIWLAEHAMQVAQLAVDNVTKLLQDLHVELIIAQYDAAQAKYDAALAAYDVATNELIAATEKRDDVLSARSANKPICIDCDGPSK